MAAMRRRNPPVKDAKEHAARCIDKIADLEVKYINSFKGMMCFYVLIFNIFVVLAELSNTYIRI